MISQNVMDPNDPIRSAERQLDEMSRHDEAVTREREVRGQTIVTTDHRSAQAREFDQLHWLNLYSDYDRPASTTGTYCGATGLYTKRESS